MVIIRN